VELSNANEPIFQLEYERSAAPHVKIRAQSLPIHVVVPGVNVVTTLVLPLNRGVRGHGKGNHHVNFVRLSLLCDAPPARRLGCYRATDRESHAGVGIVEMGEEATVDYLMKDLALQERLDAMIDKCLKRLLLVRGVKSM